MLHCMRLPVPFLLAFALSVGMPVTASVADTMQSQFRMVSETLGAAGAPGSTSQVSLNGTLAQPMPLGNGGSTNFQHQLGFWWMLPRPGSAVDVDPLPRAYDLAQNSPNPFRGSTTVRFALPVRQHVKILVFGVGGRRVCTLLDESRGPGSYTSIWDGRDEAGRPVASGVYFCRMVAGTYSASKKMMLLQ